jgi:hypothetical protein
MKFNEAQSQIQALQQQIQEIQSTCYVVCPSPEDTFKFISFLDLESLAMSYAIVDGNMNSVELLINVPIAVMIAFGEFMAAIEAWQCDTEMDFPFMRYAGDFSEFEKLDEDPTFKPTDWKFDGEEGRIE